MTSPIGTNPLLNLRLAYLRAIACSWRDRNFQKKLLEASDIQEVLIESCGLTSFWPHLAIRVQVDSDRRKQTRWLPEKTAGWIGVNDKFVITLPNKPDDNEVDALTAYYQWFPDLLGSAHPISDFEVLANEAEAPAKKMEPVQYLPEGMGIPGGERGTLLAFGGVVLRALALAWDQPQFLEELTQDGELQPDAAPVLSKWLGYNNPFNFFLLFRQDEDENFKWIDGELQVAGKPNTIILNLPVAPEKRKIWPIALTSYNNTGPAYPFTCA